MTSGNILWNWLVHDGPPSGANRRREELLKALTLDPSRLRGRAIVILTRAGAVLPELPPGVRLTRRRVPATAAGRAVVEASILRQVAKEFGCGCILQESLPVPNVKGIPIVTTIHDLRALHGDVPGNSWVRRVSAPSMLRSGFARSRALVAVSDFTKGEGTAIAPEYADRWHVVPNAADHLPLQAASVQRDEDLVLSVGHLEERKGADLLLRAFVLLSKNLPKARIRFAGRGPLTSALRTAAREAGVADRVKIDAAHDDAELCHLYASATLLAFPSHYEGFGIPVLEAQRLGCPVLAARAAALPEVAGDAAAWVDNFEPESWALHMQQLLGNGAERSRLSTTGRARSAAYSWERSATELLTILDSSTSR